MLPRCSAFPVMAHVTKSCAAPATRSGLDAGLASQKAAGDAPASAKGSGRTPRARQLEALVRRHEQEALLSVVTPLLVPGSSRLAATEGNAPIERAPRLPLGPD